MGAGHLGAELVGGPAHGDGGAVGRIVLHRALNELRLVGGAGVFAATGLPLEYAAFGLVGEWIMAAGVAEITRVTYGLLRLLEVLAVNEPKKGS